MGQYCGFDTPEILTSSGNVMTVRFKSNLYENYYGFGIVYSEQNGTSGKFFGKTRIMRHQ